MGRRKIPIEPILQDRNRAVTFSKRKHGLFKKAYELGVLCSVDVAVIIFEERTGQSTKLYQYCSSDLQELVHKQLRHVGDQELKTPVDFITSPTAAVYGDADDSDEPPESSPLYARTSSKRRGDDGLKSEGTSSHGGMSSLLNDIDYTHNMLSVPQNTTTQPSTSAAQGYNHPPNYRVIGHMENRDYERRNSFNFSKRPRLSPAPRHSSDGYHYGDTFGQLEHNRMSPSNSRSSESRTGGHSFSPLTLSPPASSPVPFNFQTASSSSHQLSTRQDTGYGPNSRGTPSMPYSARTQDHQQTEPYSVRPAVFQGYSVPQRQRAEQHPSASSKTPTESSAYDIDWPTHAASSDTSQQKSSPWANFLTEQSPRQETRFSSTTPPTRTVSAAIIKREEDERSRV